VTRLERFYRWLDTPWACELRAAERAVSRGAERHLRRAAMSPRRRAVGRAVCDAVTLACLVGILLVLALNQNSDRPRPPDRPAPAQTPVSGPVVRV